MAKMETTNNNARTGNIDPPEAGPWRMALPQILACCAKNLLLLDLGMALGFATIVIPALSGQQPDRYPNEAIHFTPELASWFGSLLFLTQPIGSLSSGWFTEVVGRKWAMIGCTVPHIVAWIVIWYCQTIVQIFVGGVLLGFGVGLMETSVVTYISEIGHPSIRGMLLLFSYVSAMFGILAIYILGAVTTWRIAASVALLVPTVTAFALLFVPESPYWLLSQRRPDDALRSLQWLRGWVSPAAVQTEFAAITNYVEEANACDACRLARLPRKCDHDSTYLEKCSDLAKPKFIKPFFMLSLCFVIIQFSGNGAIRPFLVQLMRTMRLPLDANWASVVMSVADISSNLVCMVAMSLRHIGKRLMFSVASVGCTVCAFGLSLNAYLTIPLDSSSFNQSETLHEEPATNYVALVLFLTLALCGNMAMTVPWMMISEIFPFRVRGTACGIGAAFCYFAIFVATKTYFDVENALGIAGTFLLYGVLCVFGCIIQHFMLPETEGCSLEEIEVFYSRPGHNLFDRHIKRIVKSAPQLNNVCESIGFDNEAFKET